MATRSSHQNGSVAAKLAQQGKQQSVQQQGPVNDAHKDAVQAADQAWLDEAQKAWEESRQAEADASVAAQQGELVVDLADSARGASVVGESLVDLTYPVGDEATGAAALLNSGGSSGAAGGATAGGAGAAGGIFSGAGGWIAGGLGVGFAAGTVDTGDEVAPPPSLNVISDDQAHGGVAVSADVETPAHYENIRVLLESETGPYGGVLVDGVNSHDVALLDGSDAVIKFSDQFPADVTVRAQGDYASAYAYVVATGTVNDVAVLASGDSSDASLALNYAGGPVMGASTDVSADVVLPVTHLNGGNVTVDANGDYSHAYAYLGSAAESDVGDLAYTVSGTVGHLLVSTSGDGARAGADIQLDGSVTGGIDVVTSGDVLVDESNNVSRVYGRLYADVTGNVSGGVTIDASGDGSHATGALFVDGSVAGGIEVTASGGTVINGEDAYISAYAFARMEVSGDVSGDVTVTATGNSSDAYLVSYVSGEIDGDLTVTASGGHAQGLVVVSADAGLTGDVWVSSTGDYSQADAKLIIGDSIDGDIVVDSAGTSTRSSLLINYGAAPSNYIEDGGNDQYDDGNYISTAFSSDIYYTPTVLSDDAFGTGSQHVFAYQDSIFALLVTGNQSDTFSLSGNMGADGGGSEDLAVLGEYGGFTAVAYRTSGGDPSINRLFIYEGTPDDVTVNALDGNTDNDDFTVSGLSDVSNFSYVAVFGSDDTAWIGDDELTAFFHTYVDDVMLAGGSSVASVTAALASFNDADVQTALRADLPALYEGFEFALPSATTTQLLGSDITVTATDNYAYAYAYIDSVGGTAGAVTVQGSGDGGMARVYLSLDGDISAGIDVEATGNSLGESADAQHAYAGFYTGVSGGIAGGITVSASGTGGYAVTSVQTGAGIIGDVSVTASGAMYATYYTAYAAARVYAGDNLTGDIVVSATAGSSDAYVRAYVDGVLDGDLSVVSSGDQASAGATLNAYADSSAPTVELSGAAFAIDASGQNAYASAYVGGHYLSSESQDVYMVTGTAGDIDITASGVSSDAEMRMHLAGSINGDIHVLASGDYSSALFGEDYSPAHVHILGDVTGDVAVEATGVNSHAAAYIEASTLGGDVVMTAANGGYVDVNISVLNMQDIHVSTDVDGTGTANVTVNVAQYYVDGAAEVASHVGSLSVTGGAETFVNASFADRFANDIHLGTDATAFDGNFSLSLGVGDDLFDKDAAYWSSALDATVTSEDTAFLKDHMITIDGFAEGSGVDSITFANVDFSNAVYHDGGSFASIADFLVSADAELDTVGVYFGAVDTDGLNGVDTGFLAVDSGDGGISYVIRFTDLTEFDQTYVTNSVPVVV